MPWKERYIKALKEKSETRRQIIEKAVDISEIKSFCKAVREILRKVGCEKEECALFIEDVLWSLQKALHREKRHLESQHRQIESVLYLYYLFSRIHDFIWRVKGVEEFFEELKRSLELIPFIHGLAYLLKDRCLLAKDDFTSWLERYLLTQKQEGPAIVTEKDLPDYLREPFRDGFLSVVLIPFHISEHLEGLLAFGFSKKDFSEWEKLLLLEDLPNLLAMALRFVQEKEEEHENFYFDPLTGFPRQTYFLILLEKLLGTAAKNKKTLLVGVADIDKFTSINQVFGYEVGDEILRELAQRIKTFLSESEIGRGRGGSFLFCVETDNPQELLRELKEILCRPVRTTKGEVEFTVSCGGSLFPSDGDQAKTLLRQAESALKEAKRLGGNTVCLFREDFHRKASEFLLLLPRIKRALAEKHFVVYCQPRINIKERRISGGEILVRWHDPDEGLILPGKFIWVLEESGLIRELGLWILEETCRLVNVLQKDLYMALNLSLNISPQQLQEVDLLEHFRRIFEEYGVCPSRLTLEITENIFIEHTEQVIEQITRLNQLGLRIAIDDFGTGYSSLRYLSNLPFQDLKIDMIFVQNMLNSPSDMEIVKTIVALGKILHKKLIAEGVEHVEQLKCLMEMDIDEVQGFYFSPPLPWKKFIEYVHTFDPQKYFPTF